MKFLITLFIVLYNICTINAQFWLDIGVKGTYGANLLLNKNIFNDGNYNHDLTFSGGFGGKIGFNFGQMHEITVDYMYTNFKQKFNITQSDTANRSVNEYQSSLSCAASNVYFMYRNNAEGKYLEVGPYLSIIHKGNYTTNEPYVNSPEALTAFYNRINYGMTLGFGAYLMGTDNFGVTTGFRISYNINDLISSEGQFYNYPTLKSYDTYAASNPLTVELVLELNFDLAYLAKASCGRTKLLMF